MEQSNLRLGIILMIATTFVFAMQDGISRYLAGEYNVFMIVMIRYWFFAAFVIFWAKANVGSIKKAASTHQPILQCLRGIILAVEICIMVLGFVLIGLIESLAIFTIYPLIIAALSGPILGERVGWRRSVAICIGFFWNNNNSSARVFSIQCIRNFSIMLCNFICIVWPSDQICC